MNKILKQPIIYIIAILFADQLSKYIVRTKFYLGESFSITSFFQITYLTNTGVAFSLFQGANTFFIFFSIFVLFIVYLWYRKNKNSLSPAIKLSIILIVSGALGNFIDRVTLGQITDFVDFSIGSYHWPAFNVADSCISIGGVILFFNILKIKTKVD